MDDTRVPERTFGSNAVPHRERPALLSECVTPAPVQTGGEDGPAFSRGPHNCPPRDKQSREVS